MFRSARWRGEKNRMKVVFRLQFHATQVPQLNAKRLTLSLVPGDVGKPTSRLENAVVQEGFCRWESPIYETVKFVQEPKTGMVNQRVYHLTVSTMGSSRSGLVGEASIDFADYAASTKAFNISLPLRNSNSKAMLHVTVQRQLEDSDPHREDEEGERLRKQSGVHDLKSHLSIEDADESHKSETQEDMPLSRAARIAELRRRTSIESDSTMSSCGSVSDLNPLGEVGHREDIVQRNLHSFAKSLDPTTLLLRSSTSMSEEPHVSELEWSGSSDHGISTDDSTNSSKDISVNSSDLEIEKLKSDLAVLARQADLSELELQGLRKQIVKESKRSQDLMREVTGLKQEKDSLKAECERLKPSEKWKDEMKVRNKLRYEGRDPWVILEEIRQELDYEKDLNSNLRLQLQKTQESNTELILAVQDLETMLEQRNNEASDHSSRPGGACKNTEESRRRSFRSETCEDKDQKALEELVKGHMGGKDTDLLEKKIAELYNEIEIYKRDKDGLEIQLEQLALDYEILKQENHGISYKLEQSQLLEQMNMQYECSSSLENQVESRIEELETLIEGLEEELEKQARLFEADIEAVTHAKVEQEQRAIRAEEALRKSRWKNATVAEKLQEEFKRLSVQMASTFEANEKMSMKAIAEANELRMQKRQLEEVLKDANEKLHELKEMVSHKTDEIERILANLDEKSKQLDNLKRHEEDENADFIREISRLKDEIESLKMDKNTIVVDAENLRLELEKTRKSIQEADASLQRGNTERNELSSTIFSMRKESESLVEELSELKREKDEKEAAIIRLQAETETAKAECDDLKHSLSENETEIEKHKKYEMQLKGELKKKEDAVSYLEKKLKEGRAVINNLTKSGPRNKGGSVAHSSKEVSSMKERIKLLEGQIKMKETALEASSNMFVEKERDLKSRIEELETQLEELNQTNVLALSDHQTQETMAEQNIDAMPSNKRERNKAMETELKEMQERYSEISLKFAEVEGERQQLVMTVRNLRNAKKS
ncbi:PREDICTED: myosin-13 isoform X2 [Tarenaya hassleriana]|uniref:myosin-13 isoform X2 n=1 Tax=Tarenaya hassleriana TaxID=28532 RepID=UPI00053C5F66|nr:PREDICTED: myosin-13 isoform X2 [Tarenaya hassleriana]